MLPSSPRVAGAACRHSRKPQQRRISPMLGMMVASWGCLFCVSTCTWKLAPLALLTLGPGTHTAGSFSNTSEWDLECHGRVSAGPAMTAGGRGPNHAKPQQSSSAARLSHCPLPGKLQQCSTAHKLKMSHFALIPPTARHASVHSSWNLWCQTEAHLATLVHQCPLPVEQQPIGAQRPLRDC